MNVEINSLRLKFVVESFAYKETMSNFATAIFICDRSDK